MKIGDLVEVIDEGSTWYHFKGQIFDLTKHGLIVLELRGQRVLFDAHQLEEATELPKWPEAA